MVGVFVCFICITISWAVILILSNIMGVAAANLWAIQFLASYISSVFMVGPLTSAM